jgi:hypothetical protein
MGSACVVVGRIDGIVGVTPSRTGVAEHLDGQAEQWQLDQPWTKQEDPHVSRYRRSHTRHGPSHPPRSSVPPSP